MLKDEIKPEKILVRSTNWIGDAIMTTPAVRTIRENFPEAKISMLAYPWVADIFNSSPHVDEVIIFDKKGRHRGLKGLWILSRDLKEFGFDLAILLQNAFEAAFVTTLAGIPARAGYIRDGRRLLLNYPVAIRPEVRKLHQVHYYQWLCRDLGMEPGPDELFLNLSPKVEKQAENFVATQDGRPIIGLNPGAAYGPAKCWPVERYGKLAAMIAENFNGVIPVFGTEADLKTAETIYNHAPDNIVNLAGKTSLEEAMALIGACDVFVTNDSGLMHVAAAQKTPLVAIFGSTCPVATGPFSDETSIIRKEMDCQPCFKTHCKSDFRCMKDIVVEEVFTAVENMMEEKKRR